MKLDVWASTIRNTETSSKEQRIPYYFLTSESGARNYVLSQAHGDKGGSRSNPAKVGSINLDTDEVESCGTWKDWKKREQLKNGEAIIPIGSLEAETFW
jgi:hypothetical protein